MREDQFIAAGDGRGGVSTTKTHFSLKKIYFITDRHDRGFQPSHNIFTASPVASSWSGIINLVLMVVLKLMFLLVTVNVVWVLVSPTFTTKIFIVGLMVVILCHLRVVIIHI